MTRETARRGAWFASAAVLFLVAACLPAQELSGTFVVCKEYGTVLGTFLTDVRGKDLRRLNYLCGEGVNPRFSPSDDRILFSSARGGTPGLWTMNRKGEEAQRICDGEQGDWLPDGRRIAFRRQGQIVERALDSGEETVTSPPGWKSCSWPACSPDCRKVLFVTHDGETDAIWLVTRGEPEPRRLAEGQMLSTPRWSPGGERIAYQNGAHIWMMDADGSTKRQLTAAGGTQRRPAWSPDGTAIACCQGPGPKGPWQMAVTRLEGMKTLAVPLRDARSVLCSDWGVEKPGAKPELKGTAVRPPPRIHLWETPEPAPAAPADWVAFCRERKGWHAVAAEQASSQDLRGGCVVENDVAIFVLLAGRAGAVLIPKAAAQSAIELILLDPQGTEAGPLEAVRVPRYGLDYVSLESSSRPPGAPVKAAWTIGGSQALVHVSPLENAGKLRVSAAMPCAVVPDRFGNDIVADAEALGEGRAPLPWAPLVTGFLGSGSAMLVLVSPEPGQRTELRKGKGPAFLGADVALRSESVAAGIVTGERIWHLERFGPEGETDPLRFKWAMPCAATWRLTVQGDGQRFSALFSDKESAFFDKKDVLFRSSKGFSPAAVRLGVIYLYDRTAGTPPDALTPVDLVRDALGLKRAQQALDEEGLTSYRRAAGPTTWAELSVTLESLSYLFERKLEVQESAYAGHLCDDVPLFVEGMDRRLKEYALFVREVQTLCKPWPASAKLLESLAAPIQKLAELEEKQRGLKGCQELLPLCAKIKQLTAQESGENRKQFEECRKGILAVAGPREELLKAYRACAVALRDAAGSAPLEQAELSGLAEKMRALCKDVLRNRFYTEAGWRGEAYEVPGFWLGPRPFE
ncbi:MAG: hypothetical protein NTW87_00100 [Planctomycetota bacterium]|nr:hypothetical protein [Planctomycetota bacterium]